MAFSDPISTSAPVYDSKPNTIVTPNSWWGPAIAAPYPTNTWFMDFVLDPSQEQLDSNGDRRTTIWPYNLRARSNGFDVNRPFIRLYPDGRSLRNEYQINYDATATNWGWTSPQAPSIWRYLDLTLRANETITSRYVSAYDQLSATLRWNVDGTHYMEAPIVRGMAYSTMRYTALTPVFATANTDYHSIATINGAAPSGTVSGTKFKIAINRPYLGAGATETWVLYASSSISFTATNGSLTATAPFTGYLRLAMIGDGSGAETALDTYKDAVPTGGTTSVSVSGNTSTTTFTYSKIGSGSTLLTYCLPHHEATLTSPAYAPNHTFTTIRGTLHAVVGNTWTMTDTLSTITWNSPNAIDSSKIAAITSALSTEKTFQASNLDATEAYTFGKQISRAARLALIADQLGDTTARTSIVNSMKTYLTPWFSNSANASTTLSLVYDTTWGGILSNNALVTSPPGNPNQATEFGNAVYNDHYFHWGYYIYAAAVIAKFDSTWATTYRNKVNDIIRDIANPSASGDPYFTQLRHYDWFEGHSWAAGLQSNGDGRNQESTSEALHAWYGINLWGLATAQPDLRNVGRFLQAAETRAAHLYWQMPSTNNVYPSNFASQKMVALVFANKVFNGTWFGLGDDQIVGIEAMPFTPATHELLLKPYVQEMYPVRLDNKDTVGTATTPGGWLGTTLAIQSIIDPNTAFTAIQGVSTGDPEYIDKQGASKTNLLWWAAVQDSATAAPTTTTTSLSASPASSAASGATITLTATVSPAAAGTMTFFDSATQIGSSPVSGSTGSISLSNLSTGSHSLTATFTPSNSAAYASSTSSITSYTITGSGAAATTTTLAVSPVSTAMQGATVTLTATVSSSSAPGSVAFKDGASTIATVAVTAGSASTTTSSLSVGSHTLTAEFTSSNQGSYANSTSAGTGYTVTSSGGGSNASNASAVPFMAFSTGKPVPAVRVAVNDANYPVVASDSIVAFTALSAARTVTLPAPSTNIGRILVIKDESGSCSGGNTITIVGTVDGATNLVLNSAYAHARLYAGSTGWYKIAP